MSPNFDGTEIKIYYVHTCIDTYSIRKWDDSVVPFYNYGPSAQGEMLEIT
jgi:hypothetical protein